MRARCLLLLLLLQGEGGYGPVGECYGPVGRKVVELRGRNVQGLESSQSTKPGTIAVPRGSEDAARVSAQQAEACFGKCIELLSMASDHHLAAATTSVGKTPSLQLAFEQLDVDRLIVDDQDGGCGGHLRAKAKGQDCPSAS